MYCQNMKYMCGNKVCRLFSYACIPCATDINANNSSPVGRCITRRRCRFSHQLTPCRIAEVQRNRTYVYTILYKAEVPPRPHASCLRTEPIPRGREVLVIAETTTSR